MSPHTAAAANAATQKPRLPPNPWTIPFGNSVEVTVAGIHDEDDSADKWWAPNGVEIAPPKLASNPRMNLSSVGRTVRITIAMTAPDIRGMSMQAKVSGSLIPGSSASASDSLYLLNTYAAILPNAETADLQIDVANGDWNETVLYDSTVTASVPTDRTPVKIASIDESDGKTLVHTLDSRWVIPDREESVVAKVNGKIVEAQNFRRDGILPAYTYTFEHPKDQIKQVIYRWRTYQSVQLKNVSLRPTTIPTNVQIIPATQPQ